MANIQPYIEQIQNAVYGEEVRSSIVNALVKVNDDNDSYVDLKKEIIAAKDAVDEDVDEVQQKINAASTALAICRMPQVQPIQQKAIWNLQQRQPMQQKLI